MFLEELLKKCEFVMNRRNTNINCEPQPVDLNGFAIDPLATVDRLFNHSMNYTAAKYIFLVDGRASYDGVSLVLPSIPKPVTQIDGKDYFLVAGLYKNSSKVRYEWDYEASSRRYFITESEIFLADMASIGNPLYGVGPTGKSNYFFGLCEHPIAPFEDKDKSIFSFGGVIAIGSSYHNDYEETGLDTEIRILPPSALKLIEKWRQEATKNAI
jgi:hypothetical protein